MPAYPGLGMPLRSDEDRSSPLYPCGAHGRCSGSQSDPLPVREVAMMKIMDLLTDKEEWETKIFDEGMVARWRDEALKIPDKDLWELGTGGKRDESTSDGGVSMREDFDAQHIPPAENIMTITTINCCIDELQSKSRYYQKTGIVPTLDACACVAKSDTLVPTSIGNHLRAAFATLAAELPIDWHPITNATVRNLVHPSMFPLVFDRSKVISDEVVGVYDAINKWAGKGTTVQRNNAPKDFGREATYRSRFDIPGREVNDRSTWDIPLNYWSDSYQWLPANVAFQDEHSNSVKFTSYINNLHPGKYFSVYQTIEKLLEVCLPLWDQCLSRQTGFGEAVSRHGRTESRFVTTMPNDMDDSNQHLWSPPDPQGTAREKVDWEALRRERIFFFDPRHEDEAEAKWRWLRRAKIPEPTFQDVDYHPASRLSDRFRESGLQIIVKMAYVELTPDKPEAPPGGWHIEGQMNERICATALYYVDCENVTPSHLSFRMMTSDYLQDDSRYSVSQGSYHWMEEIFGTRLGASTSPCLQNYGDVETREGRLLAFPNVFQHRVSSFRLLDPTKPGRRHFIALWLVDPHRRIISTANVPPQQRDWWSEAILGSTKESRHDAMNRISPEIQAFLGDDHSGAVLPAGRLPPELMEMVKAYLTNQSDLGMMGYEEAKAHRLKLMQERSRFVQNTGEGWRARSYSFCEH